MSSGSYVWNHFSKSRIKKDTAICNYCKKEILCKGSSTSGLTRHISSQHKDKDHIIDSSISTNQGTSTDSSNPSAPKIAKLQQSSILKYADRKQLSEIVARLATVDGFSINGIANSQFIRQSLVARGSDYALPIGNTNVMKLVHQQFELAKFEVTQRFKAMLNAGDRFSITLDEWTSRKNRGYLNVNVHFKDGDFVNLGLERIPGRCPAEVIKSLTEKKLCAFSLKSKDIVSSTTDGASTMKKFGRETDFMHQTCYVHAIHLAVTDVIYKKIEVPVNSNSDNELENDYISDNYCSSSDSLSSDEESNGNHIQKSILVERQQFKNILDSVRKIVKMFRKSPVKNSILQKYCKEKFHKDLELLLDCPTRWNSIETMLGRFLKVESCIKKALKDLNSSELISDDMISQIKKLHSTFKPIKLAVEALGATDANLLSAEGIFKFLFDALKIQCESDDDIHSQIANAVMERISERRNLDLVSLIKYLNNYKSLKEEESTLLPHATKPRIIRLAKNLMNHLFLYGNFIYISCAYNIIKISLW